MGLFHFQPSAVRQLCAGMLLLLGVGLWCPGATAVESAVSAQPLSLSVSASQSSAPAGSTITWTAHAGGGTTPYSFCYYLVRTDEGNEMETLLAFCSMEPSVSYICDRAGIYRMKVSLMSISNPEYEIDAWSTVTITQDPDDLPFPQTGDSAHPAFWTILALLSAACIGGVLTGKRRCIL